MLETICDIMVDAYKRNWNTPELAEEDKDTYYGA